MAGIRTCRITPPIMFFSFSRFNSSYFSIYPFLSSTTLFLALIYLLSSSPPFCIRLFPPSVSFLFIIITAKFVFFSFSSSSYCYYIYVFAHFFLNNYSSFTLLFLLLFLLNSYKLICLPCLHNDSTLH